MPEDLDASKTSEASSAVERGSFRFWGETDVLPLKLFSDRDYRDFNMEPDALHGVQAKVFARDERGVAWCLKSGALGDEGSTRPSPTEERTRRAAFPVHEALVAALLKSVGTYANDVDLGFRTLKAVDEAPLRLLVSVHRMVHGQRRDHVQDFQPPDAFYEDLFTLLCINVVVGQRDHERHNYLVGEGGRLISIDNGACMKYDWLTTDLTPQLFEGVKSLEAGAPIWDPTLRERVQQRVRPLAATIVDNIIKALPTETVAWHDEAAGLGFYCAGTITQKQERLKKNLDVLCDWATRRA